MNKQTAISEGYWYQFKAIIPQWYLRTKEFKSTSYLFIFERSDNYKRLTIYGNKRNMTNRIMLYHQLK